jgi:hypothetical protein
MKYRVKIFLLHFIIFLGGLHATFAQEKVDTTHLKKNANTFAKACFFDEYCDSWKWSGIQ